LPRPNAIVGAIGSCPCPLLGCPLLGCPLIGCPFVERMKGNSPCPFIERMIGNSPCPPIGCGNSPCPPIGCGNSPCPPLGCGNSPCPPIGCPLLERMMGNTVDRANPSQCSYITKYYMAKCGQVGGATTSRSATQSPIALIPVFASHPPCGRVLHKVVGGSSPQPTLLHLMVLWLLW